MVADLATLFTRNEYWERLETISKMNRCFVVFAVVFLVGPVWSSRFDNLQIKKPSSSYSDAESAVGGASSPIFSWEGPHSKCWSPLINGTRTKQCTCADGFEGNSPLCRPGPELLALCYNDDPCGTYSNCLVRNGTRTCYCVLNYKGEPPHCVADDQLQECIRSARCGPNSECIPHFAEDCFCLPGFVGVPPNCTASSRLLAHCNPYPCGPHSNCTMRNKAPVCSCLPGYIGKPPYCKPGPLVWRLCYKDRPCGYNAECTVDSNQVASCACSDGSSGKPPHCRLTNIAK